MHLKKISVLNFKNYPEAQLDFNSRVNCLTGNNGEGKTNILDAIHYLSFCKSFFNPIDTQNILHEAPFFLIQGIFDADAKEEEIYCGLKRNQKKQFKRNKKEYQRLADHIGLFPLVMISPADSELITEGSESRRKFIDSVIAQFDRAYLENLINYNKVLSQRNALLKQIADSGKFEKESLEIWDDQLVAYGIKVYDTRKNFITKFIPIFQKYYELISGGRELVGIEYNSHLNASGFKEVLENALKRDRMMEYTTVGIHKDDLEFTINTHPLKKYASQGQQKSFLIALKLAQFDYIKNIKEVTPILLLDDIYDKLDDLRVKQLMELVSSDNFGQLFITDTHPTRLAEIFNKGNADFKVFSIKNNTIESKINF
ncbi:MAG: DNA recombination protein RecF [Bacteroidetes bacterium RIFCSPLOWO2_12_FULL_35_15]|nr:MAG: DNA recombination protein RecF [Bacteroidetes bacterium RIFCSPLOWO2_12_FULL_35_15]